ncbi:molybdopterin converting factor subunit 1 [Bosea sp. (in: a-proteobacteria)]|uniref:molybdopterin converting factor subunit 1 n=1 Tax=Bosea sp. (in: a-proteobacteria) TaxID=1871050 RepID=UPI00262ABA14|nr:molybdopterin converting factor subunit 1 [Bosea sp. (in: a-proteobacteria)]MCO5091112.1 molybdopterin converting factor subunit 1 [Bosea sp. (in: a-proteobacteria)]
MRIVYFAWVRERVGLPEETLPIPAGLATVADLVRWLKARGEGYEAAFANERIVRAALDHVHAKPESPLGGAREIAFFPPMTGG